MKRRAKGERKTSPRRIAAQLRAYEAAKLRTAGATYRQIMATLGYAGPGKVHEALTKVMREAKREDVDQMRELENARLDYALSKVYPVFDHPDAAAITAATAALVRISKRRSEINGLDAPARAPVDGEGNTVTAPILNLTLSRGTEPRTP